MGWGFFPTGGLARRFRPQREEAGLEADARFSCARETHEASLPTPVVPLGASSPSSPPIRLALALRPSMGVNLRRASCGPKEVQPCEFTVDFVPDFHSGPDLVRPANWATTASRSSGATGGEPSTSCKPIAGHGPHDLELVAVRVMRVERLRRAVVALADQRTGSEQRLSGVHEVFDATDLPRQVVEADGAADRARRAVADREQPEVVIVLGALGAEEGRPHRLPIVMDGLESEDVSVERD